MPVVSLLRTAQLSHAVVANALTRRPALSPVATSKHLHAVTSEGRRVPGHPRDAYPCDAYVGQLRTDLHCESARGEQSTLAALAGRAMIMVDGRVEGSYTQQYRTTQRLVHITTAFNIPCPWPHALLWPTRHRSCFERELWRNLLEPRALWVELRGHQEVQEEVGQAPPQARQTLL